MAFNPEVPVESQFAVDPIDPGSFAVHRTGAETNEMDLTFPSGFDFRCRHELKKPIEDAGHNLNSKQIWEDLKRYSVTEGKPLSNPLQCSFV
jgi:hypothetical protein